MTEMSKEEQIGFQKGAIVTLEKEKEALLNMLNIVDQLIMMHKSNLETLGVPTNTTQNPEPRKKKMPIEDIL